MFLQKDSIDVFILICFCIISTRKFVFKRNAVFVNALMATRPVLIASTINMSGFVKIPRDCDANAKWDIKISGCN